MHELLTGRAAVLRPERPGDAGPGEGEGHSAPSALNPGVKPALDGVVLRALSRDPDSATPARARSATSWRSWPCARLSAARVRQKGARARAGRGRDGGGGHVARAVTTASADAPGPVPAAVGREDSSMMVDDRARGPSRRRPRPRRRPRRARNRHADRSGLWLGAPVLCLASGGIGAAIPAPAARPWSRRCRRQRLHRRPSRPRGSRSIRRRRERPSSPPRRAASRRDAVLLTLPRGQTTMDLVVHKSGFAPLPFKVIPHQDKDFVARLEPLARGAAAQGGPGVEGGQAIVVVSSAGARAHCPPRRGSGPNRGARDASGRAARVPVAVIGPPGFAAAGDGTARATGRDGPADETLTPAAPARSAGVRLPRKQQSTAPSGGATRHGCRPRVRGTSAPSLPVEQLDDERVGVDAFQTAKVDVDVARIRTRRIEGVDAAVAAELVLATPVLNV